MTTTDDDFGARLTAIEGRNRRVEADKAWERSIARRLLIAAFTYVVVVAYNSAIDVDDPWLTAAVPVAGFLLSTLTLPAVKRFWVRRRFG